jgi:hypothetical protein
MYETAGLPPQCYSAEVVPAPFWNVLKVGEISLIVGYFILDLHLKVSIFQSCLVRTSGLDWQSFYFMN